MSNIITHQLQFNKYILNSIVGKLIILKHVWHTFLLALYPIYYYKYEHSSYKALIMHFKIMT